MPTQRLTPVLRYLCRAAGTHDTLDDGELLERFVARRDEAAFEALLRRHGPMVFGVCRRVLANEADAEDAFQATFLVLVRKAASVVPRALVGNWLYGVAHNTARKAKAMNDNRRAKERQAGAAPRPEASGDVERHRLALLDEELSRLPERYRAPVVLCDLEGRPYKEAAKQLGVPLGTLSGRLTRARALLARRLAGRGLIPGAAPLAGLAPASVPVPLLVATREAASALAAGSPILAAATSAKAAALTEGVLKTMLLNKLKTTGVLLALCVACAWGAAALWSAAGQPGPQADPSRTAEPASRLDGLWADLASADEAKATRAALALVATKDAVPFLKDRLKPVKVDAKRVAQLIEQLDSDDFARREEAANELDYLGKFIKTDLERAAKDTKSAEVTKRVQDMLGRIASETAGPAAPPALTGNRVEASSVNGKITVTIDGKPINLTPTAAAPAPRLAWVRVARAAAVLEHVGTPEAQKILEALADGEAEAPPTKAAKEALDRLKK
jgi:RNA polymerase sigma factor (sigma-70 family)